MIFINPGMHVAKIKTSCNWSSTHFAVRIVTHSILTSAQSSGSNCTFV